MKREDSPVFRPGERAPWRGLPVRAWFSALAFALFGCVALALELQTLLHLAPCPLCIFQRLLHLILVFLALAGFVLPALRLFWGSLIALVSLGGFAVAAYQSWMQAFPGSLPGCSYADPNAIERLVDALGMRWPSLFMATGFCESRDWEFLGLSMANASMLIFAAVAVFAVWLIRGARG